MVRKSPKVTELCFGEKRSLYKQKSYALKVDAKQIGREWYF